HRHRPPPRRLGEHRRTLLLRARRRVRRPDPERHQALPLGVRGRHAHPRARALPVRGLGRVLRSRCPMTTTASTPATTEQRDLLTVTIDGVEVDVPKGTLVIRAAEQVGIQIPRFCDHPLLKPAGACRQCLVEVSTPDREGNLRAMPKPQTSCTLEATPGMVVATQHTSAVADKAQHGMIEFLLINHPLDCPVCDKGGECPLQNQAMSDGRATTRFVDVKRTFPKPLKISSE